MERNPIQSDARKGRRKRKLGPDAVCILCGESRPEALMAVPRSFLHQAHHVVGDVNDPDLTVPVCLNCHAKETERQRGYGVNLHRDRMRTLPETLISILRALAAFFHSLGERLAYWAEELADFVRALDIQYPQWRDLPEAQQ